MKTRTPKSNTQTHMATHLQQLDKLSSNTGLFHQTQVTASRYSAASMLLLFKAEAETLIPFQQSSHTNQ